MAGGHAVLARLPAAYKSDSSLPALVPQQQQQQGKKEELLLLLPVSRTGRVGGSSSSSSRQYADLRHIKGLCAGGKVQEALDGLALQDHPPPPLQVYSYLLQTLSKRKKVAEAKQLHALLRERGLDTSEPFLGEWLVNMLVRCGGVSDAVEVFRSLRPRRRTVLSWNAVISGLSKTEGQWRQALRMYYSEMRESVEPDKHTFVSLLRACGGLGDLQEGRRVHDEVVRRGYGSDLFVCTSLIDMYSKCGSIVDAQRVFDGIAEQRDLGSWNAMVAGYAQHGWGDKALKLYEQMMVEQEGGGGVSPDERTFVGVLAGCSSLLVDCCRLHQVQNEGEQTIRAYAMQKVRQLHAETARRGFHSNIFIGNTLIHVYASCGSTADAQLVMDGLPAHNLVSWNALLAGFAQQGKGTGALAVYAAMREQGGYRPNDRTFASLLKACSNLAGAAGATKDEEDEEEGMVLGFGGGEQQQQSVVVKAEAVQRGKEVHAEALRSGYDSDFHVVNTLVHMYASCGDVEDARHVFDSLPHRDVVTWNSMIEGYALQEEQSDMALELYALMMEEESEEMEPDDRTFVSVLKACGNLAAQEKETVSIMMSGYGHAAAAAAVKVVSLARLKAVHAAVIVSGYLSDVYVGNSLVHVYASCGSLVDARQVFDALSHRDVVSWNAMISGYAWQDQAEQALHLFATLQQQQQGEGGVVTPDETTFLAVLKAASSMGALKLLKQIHHAILSSGYGKSVTVASALIHAYGKAGNMAEARTVFDSLPHHNVVTWTALVAGYARLGEHSNTLACFERMQRAGVRPNLVTFIPLLSACSHAGLVDKGVDYLESMSRLHGLTPTSEHYVSVVDLLGRAGLLSTAETVVAAMPVAPDLPVCLSLLGACRKYGDVEVGRRAFDRAVSLDPDHCAAYTLMHNIYAHAGMWREAAEVDERRGRGVAWKRSGQSWIEHQCEVHSFVVGDNSGHRQSCLVNAQLEELGARLKAGGYYEDVVPPDCDKQSLVVEESQWSL